MPANPRYGWRHIRTRERWKPLVERGEVCCARCGLLIEPGTPWDLGHVDGASDREYAGPEHASCNRRAGGRGGGRGSAPRSRPVRADWW